MKILAVLPTFRPESYSGKVGGGEISNRILLQSLADLGHSVTVCSISAGHHTETKVNVQSSEGKIWGKFLNKIIGLVRFRVLTTIVAKKERPDIILCGTKGVGIAVKQGHKLGVPVGVFIRAFENIEENTKAVSFASKIKKMLGFFVYGSYGHSMIGQASFLLPNSIYMEKVCLESFPDKETKIVYPPLVTTKLMPLKVSDTVKSIYMIGTSKDKGIHILYALSEHFPNVEFGIVGDASVPPGKVQVKGNIKRYGWANVVNLLAKEADVLIVPSICREAFGRVAIEGLIAGCPVLASDIGGLPEAVSFETALLVEPDNIDGWVELVFQIIKNPKAFRKATENARDNISVYSLHNQVNELNQYLKDRIH